MQIAISFNVKISRGNTAEVPFTELILRLTSSGFSGRLTLNEGEHFCIIEFLKGNVTGAFGWKLGGDNAILHLLLEKETFPFALPYETDVGEKTDSSSLPRGSKHILELVGMFENNFGFLKGKLHKSIVMNENPEEDIDLTGKEMVEVMRFARPVPLDNLVNEHLKQNLFDLKRFFDKKLLVVVG